MRNDKVNTIPLARMLEVKTGISSRAIYSRDWQLWKSSIHWVGIPAAFSLTSVDKDFPLT